MTPDDGELLRLYEQMLMIRRCEERLAAGYASGKVPGSLNIPLAEFLAKADPGSPDHEPSLQPDKAVILYCASGKRSLFAGNKLVEFGYREVYNLGGFKDWAMRGEPVER